MERAPIRAPVIKNLELKVGLLLVGTLCLAVGLLFYALYARGVFEPTQKLTLLAENAEGVSVGMPLSFSGFPIGKVSRMDLTEDGKVRIQLEIPLKDARWLRTSSAFVIEKPIVGAAKIRAYSANLKDPPLEDGAERAVYAGDATQDLPELIAKVKGILTNVELMTRPDSSLNRSLARVETVTTRMAGEYGVLEGVLGSPDKAREVVEALKHANSLLAKTEQRVYGPAGLMDQAQQSVAQLNAILADARESLKKADAILANAQAASADVVQITGNVKGATTDLGTLRSEVEDSLRKVNHLINEINRKWPFARDVELKLP